jgi:hypothetical protein
MLDASVWYHGTHLDGHNLSRRPPLSPLLSVGLKTVSKIYYLPPRILSSRRRFVLLTCAMRDVDATACDNDDSLEFIMGDGEEETYFEEDIIVEKIHCG